MAQGMKNQHSVCEDVGVALALLSSLRIQLCPKLWCRSQMHGSDLVLWLWHRLETAALIAALIPALAWELPNAALKLKNKIKNAFAQLKVQNEIQRYKVRKFPFW